MNLKAGDKVLISARYNRSIGVVKQITPAGNIRLTNGELYTSTGQLKTRDVWSASYIQPLMPELERELQRDSVIAKTLHLMHNTTCITYEQAVSILEVLRKPQEKI